MHIRRDKGCKESELIFKQAEARRLTCELAFRLVFTRPVFPILGLFNIG